MSLPSAPHLIAPLLAMESITKRFPGVIANDRVSLRVHAGEIHALLGENGAGKSTLMSILYGLYQPDEGEVLIAGERVHFYSPRDAIAKGVGLVAQHFTLARRHTVVENIALGLPNTPALFPTRKLTNEIRRLGEHYGLPVDPNAKIHTLSAGEQQRVEILKVLMGGARILILDEPTSVLTPQEADALFAVIKQMREEGKAIIFITHKLEEVMATADRITVLRKGAVVGTIDASEASPPQLARLMVGREIEGARVTPKAPGEKLLTVTGLRARNNRKVEALKGVSFDLYRGEILGVAGVAGNGQSELIETLTGLRQPTHGHMRLRDIDLAPLNARGVLEAGVAHIPEDRNHMGIVPSMSVAENFVLRQYRYKPFSRGALLNPKAIERFAKEAINDYNIATPSHRTTSSLLSGGNVQKIILARELSGEPKLIVAAHPTYGLDVSATEQTHRLLLAQRERGAGVLLFSEDLEEIFNLSDRIMVMFAGHVIATVPAAEADRERIGLMMAGVAA